MTKWLKLDPSELTKAEAKTIRGADVQVYLSPYDVPEAVRGCYNKDTELFIIEFKYIGGNEPETDVTGDKITFRVGIHSNRLYSIEIPWPEKNLHGHVTLPLPSMELEKIFDTLAKRPGAARRTANYEVAKKILSKRAKELSREVAV